ncbi:MAG: hypothetical protein AAF708_18625 [Deinococcota bacterium]
MRHVYVSRATYILTICLLLFVLGFALIRSNNIILFASGTPVTREVQEPPSGD